MPGVPKVERCQGCKRRRVKVKKIRDIIAVLVLISEVRPELADLHALQEVETCLFGTFKFT